MARIGGTKCQVCGNADATVSKTATGTLSIACHRCESTAFAKVGTRAHRLISASMTPDDDDSSTTTTAAPPPPPAKAKASKPEAAPPVTPATPTPAAPRRVASVFSLADL